MLYVRPIIQGPVGPSCQMPLVFAEAVALLTELNGASETWLMTCNYADGDRAAERVCRAVLASVRPKKAFERPDPVALASARAFARLTDPLAYLIYELRRVFNL